MSISLRDLEPIKVPVPIRGDRELIVHGLGTKYINVVLNRFQELRKAFVEQAKTMNMVEVASFTPTLLAAICAQGLVAPVPGDKDAEREKEIERVEAEVAEILVVGEQIDIAVKVFEATFPRGTAPFLKVLRELGVLTEAKGGGAAAPVSASADTGKAQDTSSESSETT